MTERVAWTVDRTGWGDGPWTGEPDRVQWQHVGFACLAVRNAAGAWCGYVGVPNTHPAYEKDYDDVNVRVHGGLTFADRCQDSGPICHIPEPGMPADVWWLGFDTAHHMDFLPSNTTAERRASFERIIRERDATTPLGAGDA